MEAKQQICVRLKKEIMDELKELSKANDLPVAWFISQSVKMYLEQQKRGR